MQTKTLFFEGQDGKKAFYGKPSIATIEAGLAQLQHQQLARRFPTPIKATITADTTLNQTDGLPVSGTFLVGTALNKGKYISFQLENTSATFEGRQWVNGDGRQQLELLETTAAHISGKMNEFPKGSGRFSIMCTQIKPLHLDETAAQALQRQLPEDVSFQAIVDEFFYYISLLDEAHQQATFTLLDEVWTDFATRYGAKGHHHNYRGGLLQHTVEVLRIATTIFAQSDDPLTLAKHFNVLVRLFQSLGWQEMLTSVAKEQPRLPFNSYSEASEHLLSICQQTLAAHLHDQGSINTLVFGIIFHDIGKIIEYSTVGDNSGEKYKLWFGADFEVPHYRAGAIDMDVIGKRFGHIQLGVMYLSRAMYQQATLLPLNAWLDAIAIIQSHHGKAEWGSPQQPRTTIELMVHLADFIDSRIASEH